MHTGCGIFFSIVLNWALYCGRRGCFIKELTKVLILPLFSHVNYGKLTEFNRTTHIHKFTHVPACLPEQGLNKLSIAEVLLMEYKIKQVFKL